MLHFIKDKTLNLATFSLLSFASLTIGTPSWGATIDFSSSGWEKIGNSSIPAQGEVNLQSSTNNSLANYIDDLEVFSDITPGGLDTASGLDSNNGQISAFGSATRYNAKAGDFISFQLNFSPDLNDFAFIKYNGQIEIFKTAGLSTFNITFNTDQLFVFGVVDVGDSIGTSTLQVTNATYQPVPEPISILGSLTACGFGVVIRRRFGKKS
jgi:hypothetical protein